MNGSDVFTVCFKTQNKPEFRNKKMIESTLADLLIR